MDEDLELLMKIKLTLIIFHFLAVKTTQLNISSHTGISISKLSRLIKKYQLTYLTQGGSGITHDVRKQLISESNVYIREYLSNQPQQEWRNCLAQFINIGEDQLDFIVEKNHLKWYDHKLYKPQYEKLQADTILDAAKQLRLKEKNVSKAAISRHLGIKPAKVNYLIQRFNLDISTKMYSDNEVIKLILNDYSYKQIKELTGYPEETVNNIVRRYGSLKSQKIRDQYKGALDTMVSLNFTDEQIRDKLYKVDSIRKLAQYYPEFYRILIYR